MRIERTDMPEPGEPCKRHQVSSSLKEMGDCPYCRVGHQPEGEPSVHACAVLSGELADLGDVPVPDDDTLHRILCKVYAIDNPSREGPRLTREEWKAVQAVVNGHNLSARHGLLSVRRKLRSYLTPSDTEGEDG